jgi:hypothetical protein
MLADDPSPCRSYAYGEAAQGGGDQHVIARIAATVRTPVGPSAVDASGKLVMWVIGATVTEPEPNVDELEEAKGFAGQAAISGSCPE